MVMFNLLWLIPALPFFGFLVNGLVGKKVPKGIVSWVACGVVGLAFAAALLAFKDLLALSVEERFVTQTLFTWIPSGDFLVQVGLQLDPLSAVMILVVTGVGFLIHVYSIGYMHSEEGYGRYFAYLNLFTFAMLTLVLADNFLLMFVGWEGVGLCSYLLIGFWYDKPSAANAGRKAFVVNRIGDFGFLLAMMLIFSLFGTLRFDSIFHQAPLALTFGGGMATTITLLLFLGATGKSAQIPLYIWLPDAMEGPTPVSALIHAATMVTAGVYMVARCHVLFLLAPVSLAVVAVIGALTAIFAASIGLVQNDIKRVLAYSTVSQLGYMFLGCGVGAFAAGIFHLMTHAFFKALLFLGSGSVIHALSGEQDIRKMGGIAKKVPLTHATFLVGALAIAGFPGLAGFFSKDEILWKAFSSSQGSNLLWLFGALAALFTAFYMFRLVFLVFHGKSRVEHERELHLHESPPTMLFALVVLALLSIFGGYVGVPKILGGHNLFESFLEPAFTRYFVLESATEGLHSLSLEWTLLLASVAIALLGIFLAWVLYLKRAQIPATLTARLPGIYNLILNKYYVDEVYGALFVIPGRKLSEFLYARFDLGIVDGLVNFVGEFVVRAGEGLKPIQTGYVRQYGFAFLLSALCVLGYFLLR
jgi:NADH-quinone oxidoreductase subunit L